MSQGSIKEIIIAAAEHGRVDAIDHLSHARAQHHAFMAASRRYFSGEHHHRSDKGESQQFPA